MIRPPISRPGRLFAYEPVASTTFVPVYRSPFTSTVFGPTNVPWPSTTVTLLAFARPWRPL
jgi:hypothetical protein